MTNADEMVSGSSIDNSNDTTNNALSKKLKVGSRDDCVSTQVEQIEQRASDSNDFNSSPKLLWSPKTTKINQNTKLKKFTALIENKYNLKFGGSSINLIFY